MALVLVVKVDTTWKRKYHVFVKDRILQMSWSSAGLVPQLEGHTSRMRKNLQRIAVRRVEFPPVAPFKAQVAVHGRIRVSDGAYGNCSPMLLDTKMSSASIVPDLPRYLYNR